MYLVPGDTVNCRVEQMNPFGVFVRLPDGSEGLIHISELANHPIKDPQEVVAVGDTIQAVALHFNQQTGKIGLSRRAALST
jgi:predicted RNA-binding protein with RPS1 domain